LVALDETYIKQINFYMTFLIYVASNNISRLVKRRHLYSDEFVD